MSKMLAPAVSMAFLHTPPWEVSKRNNTLISNTARSLVTTSSCQNTQTALEPLDIPARKSMSLIVDRHSPPYGLHEYDEP